jgi:hypothetical protein
MSRADHKPIEHVGNELANELFDTCAALKAVQHQLDAIEGDAVHSVSTEAHEAGRVLRRAYRSVNQLAVLLADCQVTVHPSHQPKLHQLLGRAGGAA